MFNKRSMFIQQFLGKTWMKAARQARREFKNLLTTDAREHTPY